MSIVAQIKKISGDTFTYGLSSVLQKLITVFLFPIYARLLSQSDFGIQDIVLSTVNIIVLFLVLGMDSAVMQYYYEVDEKNRKKIVSTLLWFQLLVSVPTVLLICYFSETICYYFFDDPTISKYLMLGVASIPFSLLGGAMLNILRLTFQRKRFILLSSAGIFLQLILAVLFVIVFKMQITGVFLSILIAYTLQAILGFILTYREYTFSISFSWLPKLLKIGLPLVPAAISYWVMGYANRYFLVDYGGMDDIGMLSVVNRISSILLLFLSAFAAAWGPYAYNLAVDRELARETFGKILTLYLFAVLFATMLLSLFARELILVLASITYEAGAPLVLVYLISSVLWGINYIVGIGTGIARKNHHYTIAIISGAIISVLINYFFIPSYGLWAAAYANLAGNFVAAGYMFFAGQHYLKVNYEYRKLLIIIVVHVALSIIGLIIDDFYPKWSSVLLAYKFALMALSAGLLLLFGIINKHQFIFIKSLMLKKSVKL